MRSSAKQEELVKAFKALLKEEKFSSQERSSSAAGRGLREYQPIEGFPHAHQNLARCVPVTPKWKWSAACLPSLGYRPPPAPLKNLVLDIDYNDAVVVIHTSPGAAQLIARLLDSLGKAEGILGSIAGDDTIFTTPARGFTVKDLHDAILVLFEQEL